MKMCGTCGSTFEDFFDFCLADGEVLVRAPGALVDAFDAPPPPRHILPPPVARTAPPAPEPRAADPVDDTPEVEEVEEIPDDDVVPTVVPAAPISAAAAPADENDGFVRQAPWVAAGVVAMGITALLLLAIVAIWWTRDVWTVAPAPLPPPPVMAVEIDPVDPQPPPEGSETPAEAPLASGAESEPEKPAPGIVEAPTPTPAPAVTPPPAAVVPAVAATPRPPRPPTPPKPPEPEALASVLVESWPPGAAVTVSGKALGLTPVTLSLPRGKADLVVALDGYVPWKGRVDIAADSVAVPPIALERVPEKVPEGDVLVFFAGRVGDALSVDGRDVGRLPAQVRLSQGAHTFVVTGPTGAFQVTREVTVSPTKPTQLHLDR